MRYLIFLLTFMSSFSFGQNPYTSFDKEVKDVDLTDVTWVYVSKKHYESNTIVHKAGEKYKSYLFFRYDNTVQVFHKNKFSKQDWCLNHNKLKFEYNNQTEFTIRSLENNVLVLEYKSAINQSTFQYTFIKEPTLDTIFTKPGNELPLVKVNQTAKRPWWAFWRKKEKKLPPKPQKERLYINIELTGGGYYGGINPVVLDYIKINPKGRLIMEHKTRRGEHTVIKKDIPLEELEAFGNWVFRQGFFEMERAYKCQDGNCQRRKLKKPKPMPLRLLIAYGKRSKMITLDIWGLDHMKQKYMDYPPVLDNIIDAIQRMAHT